MAEGAPARSLSLPPSPSPSPPVRKINMAPSKEFRTPPLYLCFFSMAIFMSTTQSQRNLSADPSYYYNLCATSKCGNLSLRYPFGLPTPCHIWPRKASCIDNKTFHMFHPGNMDSYKFLSIDYSDPTTLTILVASDSLFTCGLQISRPNYYNTGISFTLPGTYTIGTHFNCTAPIYPNQVTGLQNASCLGCDGQDPSSFCYYAPGYLLRAPNCETFSVFTLGGPPNASSSRNLRKVVRLGFELKYSKTITCLGCEASGGRCGANPSSGKFICFCPSSAHSMNCTDGMIEDLSTWVNGARKGKSGLSRRTVAAICASASALILGFFGILLAIYIHRRKPTIIFIERAISNISPVRYSYSQLKRFTNNFSSKLGEGGFGSVFRGTITQSGLQIHVAIKLLKRSQQTKKQFMNEVATLGSMHHNNLVLLLGYCVEGEVHALVYEFMENGSLDRYIYKITNEKDGVIAKCKSNDKCLSFKQVYSIALETARGILYLHKGCNKKILHCDIKPPNILLDSNFSAKVSDFGLARMIDKDHSHLLLTQAQGTPGYAAPEMWLRSHGPITEKSDVYGYGMLILEMVGGRKNYNVGASGSSQVYFPEWLYNKIEKEEFPLLIRESDGGNYLEDIRDDEGHKVGDDEMAIQRMCLVGLWCIQHIPSNRPSMDKVVQMLEGHAEIAIPPYPFPHNTPFLST